MHRITKTALALATLPLPVAGLLALAPPASAHGTTQHTVALSGHLSIVDRDDLSPDEECEVDVADNDTAQLPVDPQANLSAVVTCDEVRVTITAAGTLSSTGVVSLTGKVVAEDKDCFLACGFKPIGSRSFSRTLAPLSSTPPITGLITDAQGSAGYTLTFSNSY
jgi:hypothetical protein